MACSSLAPAYGVRVACYRFSPSFSVSPDSRPCPFVPFRHLVDPGHRDFRTPFSMHLRKTARREWLARASRQRMECASLATAFHHPSAFLLIHVLVPLVLSVT